MPDNNGQLAFTQSEIKDNVDHAGLSVPLKPSLTEFALCPDNKIKLEFQLKIYSHAVDSHAVTDATVVTQLLPGDGSFQPESLVVSYIKTPLGANHIQSHHANTTSQMLPTHALVMPQPHHAKDHANHYITKDMLTIRDSPNQPTQSQPTSRESNSKC